MSAPTARPRDAAGLLAGTVLLGLGERLGERFLPLFLVQLGGGALAVGLYQTALNGIGAVAALPGGWMADRQGTKRALQWSAAGATAGFALLAMAPGWPAAVAGALLALSWSAVSLPASLVLITRALPARSSAWAVTVHSLVRRVPMALGPIVAGALIQARGEIEGLRAAFALALGLGLVTLALQQWWIGGVSPTATVTGRPPAIRLRPLATLRNMSPPLRRLFVADTLIRFCEQIPYAFVVLWCLHELPAPIGALQFAQLTVIEMAVAAAAYVPGAWLSTRIGKRATVVVTFVFFTAFPVALLLGRSFGALVVAFTLRGLKEIGEPTRKSLILDLCPEEARATTFGAYYALRDSLAALAAALGAAIWVVSPAFTLIAAAGFGLVGLVGYAGPWGGAGRSTPPRLSPDPGTAG